MKTAGGLSKEFSLHEATSLSLHKARRTVVVLRHAVFIGFPSTGTFLFDRKEYSTSV